MNISFDIEEGEGPASVNLYLHLQAVHQKVREQVRDAINLAADEAVLYARTHVPETDSPGPHLRDTIRRSDELTYLPGGSGGGGFYEVHVVAGGHDPERWPNPFWLIEGTGLFGPRNERIYPKRETRWMGPGWWFGEGGWFWKSTKGQRPQPGWWLGAGDTADAVLAEAAHNIDMRL